jgi:hyperosmotically inducible protein
VKGILFGFVLGVVAGAGGYWYLQGSGRGDIDSARGKVVSEAAKARESLREKVADFTTSNITEELTRSGTVIREKARATGQSIADATANARTSAAIKARLLAEPGLSAFAITVDTTDGVVTLSGKVNSAEQVGRAVKLALETDGVRKVISTLQVSSSK